MPRGLPSYLPRWLRLPGYPAPPSLAPCFFLRFRGSMSAAWQTSSNRQSGTRIWAAWSGRERGSWHPGLTAQRRPGGAARAGASLDSPGASAGHGVGPTARDPPSAQGPASRSSEGVGRTGTLPRRGGADGGAVHEPAPRSRARWGAAGGGRGAGGARPGSRRSVRPVVHSLASFPLPLLPYSRTYWQPDTGTHMHRYRHTDAQWPPSLRS